MKDFARIVLISALAAVSLSGCAMWHSTINYIRADSASTCPDAAILATTSTLPAFDPAKGSDPSGILYTAKMTDVKTRCDFSKRDFTADSNLKIFITATRPPGGLEANYRVPYYIAVTNNGDIVDKQVFWAEFEFPEGATSVNFRHDVDSFEVAVGKQKRAYEFHLLIGFQLTKAQLEFNKKMGQYAP